MAAIAHADCGSSWTKVGGAWSKAGAALDDAANEHDTRAVALVGLARAGTPDTAVFEAQAVEDAWRGAGLRDAAALANSAAQLFPTNPAGAAAIAETVATTYAGPTSPKPLTKAIAAARKTWSACGTGPAPVAIPRQPPSRDEVALAVRDAVGSTQPGSGPEWRPAAKPPVAPPPIPASGLQKTASGLQFADLAPGEGVAAVAGDTVIVDYSGWLPDGTRFDSSIERPEPFQFRLGAGRVIKGWDEGVAGMKPGGRRMLVIPPELAYGSKGAGGVIPPGATLVFDVVLIEAKPAN